MITLNKYSTVIQSVQTIKIQKLNQYLIDLLYKYFQKVKTYIANTFSEKHIFKMHVTKHIKIIPDDWTTNQIFGLNSKY